MKRSSRQKISEATVVLSDTIDPLNLINIYGTLPVNASEYTFFSNAHETFFRIGHILGHKTNINKFKRIEIYSCFLYQTGTYSRLRQIVLWRWFERWKDCVLPKLPTSTAMYSCLTYLLEIRCLTPNELVMDREAWHAIVHGVTKNETWLSDWTELNSKRTQVLMKAKFK